MRPYTSTLALTLTMLMLAAACQPDNRTSEPSVSPVETVNSMVTLESPYSVDETVERLRERLEDRGFMIPVVLDHQANAARVDLTLPPTVVLLFGNPRAGTPLMQCEQRLGIDLPQKALVYEDEGGQVHLAYNNPLYLQQRHQAGPCGGAFENAAEALAGLMAPVVE
ncbi:MAG: DUF302 domain-containing protein [Balneolaceae bacterium]